MKRRLALLMALTLATGCLAACGQKEEPAAETAAPETKVEETAKEETPAESGDSKVFGFTSMDNSNPFFITIMETIQEKVEANGDQLIVIDGAHDQQKQINGIESMISQEIDGIFLNPVESAGIEPALDALNEANIPIVTYDAGVAATDKVLTFVGSDNTNAGRVCGEDLVAKVPEGGKILVITHATADSVIKRLEGFMEAIEGKGFEVVGESDAQGDQGKAMAAATDLLQANPDVVAIFGANDPMAKGAMAAAESAGLTDVLIYGVDGSPDFKQELVKEGTLMAGTGAQSPMTIGEKAVEVMYAYLDGETVDAEYPIDTFLITADNVADYGTDGWQ